MDAFPTIGRRLPHNVDAEMAVLGALIMNPRSWDKIGGLIENDFILQEHRKIFSHLHKMRQEKKEIDPVTVKSFFNFHPELGEEKLHTLAECASLPSSFHAHVQCVISDAKKRMVIAQCEEAIELAYNCHDVDDTITGLVDHLRGGERHSNFSSAASFDMKPIRWVWPSRIPEGSITWLAGKGGGGKGLLGCQIAAHITNGTRWPDGAENNCKGRVLWMEIGEDKPEDTIVPRLHAAGCDLSKIDICRHVPNPTDLARYKMFIASPGQALCTEGYDANKDVEVRAALRPWADAAEHYGCSIFGLLHLSKSADSVTIDRVLGSVAWVNMSRITHLLVKDKDDKSRSLFSIGKSNISSPDTSAWWVRPERVGQYDQSLALVWSEAEGLEADDVIKTCVSQETNKKQTAREWLFSFLKSCGGRAEPSLVYEEGAKLGFTGDALRKAMGRDDAIISQPHGRSRLWVLNGADGL